MKKLLALMPMLLIGLMFVVSCSDDDNNNPSGPNTTTVKTDFEFDKYYELASQPTWTVYDSTSGNYIVLCWGKDNDYSDGPLDTEKGDEFPSMWTVNPSSDKVTKVATFSSALQIFSRHAVDWQARVLYICFTDHVESYNIDDYSQIDALVYECVPHNILNYETGILISNRPSWDTPGEILNIDKTMKNKIFSVDTDINPNTCQVAEVDGKKYLVLVNEGTFGAGDSKLQYAEMKSSSSPKFENYIDLGDTGNHMDIRGNICAVAVNGSHTIELIDMTKWEIVASINSGTSAGNGPREVMFITDTKIAVTNYDMSIKFFDTDTKAELKSISFDAKADGMARSNSNMLICLPNDANYGAVNKVALLKGI